MQDKENKENKKTHTTDEILSALAAIVTGIHRHRCDDCGHVWEHAEPWTAPDPDAVTETVYHAAHDCPGCHGSNQRKKYFGDAPVSTRQEYCDGAPGYRNLPVTVSRDLPGDNLTGALP